MFEWLVCVCVRLLLADILMAALLRGRSEKDRRRGGDLYFWSSYSHGVPHGRAALGSPPRMAVLGRNLQEVSSRGHHLQVTKHMDSCFDVLLYAQYRFTNQVTEQHVTAVSVHTFLFALKSVSTYCPAAEHHGTKCSNKKKKEEEASPCLQHPGLFCCCDNKDKRRQPWTAGQLCVDTTPASSQRLSAYRTDSHLAAAPSEADWSEMSVVKPFNWGAAIWLWMSTGWNHPGQRSS